MFNKIMTQLKNQKFLVNRHKVFITLNNDSVEAYFVKAR